MELRRAGRKDLGRLRKIAFQSEAHWGYDDEFMDVFEQTFNIKEDFLINNPVYVGIEQGEIVGFWGLHDSGEVCELEYFYIAAESLSHGFGKRMWKGLMEWCRENRVYAIEFVTSPQAVGFYQKMGAVMAGETQSVIDGRKIPRLQYYIEGSII